MVKTFDNKTEKLNINLLFDLLIIAVLYIRELLLLGIGEGGITSFFFYLFIVLVSCLAIKNILGILMILNKPVFLVSLFALPYMVISISYYHLIALNKTGIDSIGMIVFSLLIFFFYTNEQRQTLITIKFNTLFNVVLSFAMFVLSFSSSSYSESGLVYTFFNPNSTGLYALLMFYNIAISKPFLKNHFNSTLLNLGICFCIYILFLSKSRSAIGSLLCFAVLYCLSFKNSFEKSKKYMYYVLVFFQFFIVFFPFVWSKLLVDSGEEYSFLSKPLLSNRELIWDYMIAVINEAPYASHLGESVEYGSGPHNVFLGTWWNYGFIPYLSIIAIIFFFFKKKMEECQNKSDLLVIFALLSLYISMSFECLIVSSGINFTFRAFYLSTFIGPPCCSERKDRHLSQKKNEY